MKAFLTRHMVSQSDFSSKHILFRLLQLVLLLAFVFGVLVLYTYIADKDPALLLWAERLYTDTRATPYLLASGISALLPCLAVLLVLAVPAGLLWGHFFRAPKAAPKRLQHAVMLAGTLLLLALLGNYFLCLPSMAVGYLLPRINGSFANLSMSTWPASFTVYFSLVFVLAARFVKLLYWSIVVKKSLSLNSVAPQTVPATQAVPAP